ncbi:MAG: hypothetical protein ACK41D_02675 [Rubricoccaceae bacterium]
MWLPAMAARAQGAGGPLAGPPLTGGPEVYAGPALGPGFGAAATLSLPAAVVFTLEGTLALDYAPTLVGSSGRLVVATGAGGAVRVLRVLAVVQNEDAGPLELDAGARLGPSFVVALAEPTPASQARAFAVRLDLFARGVARLSPGRTAFAELGTQAPALRGGLAFRLARP